MNATNNNSKLENDMIKLKNFLIGKYTTTPKSKAIIPDKSVNLEDNNIIENSVNDKNIAKETKEEELMNNDIPLIDITNITSVINTTNIINEQNIVRDSGSYDNIDISDNTIENDKILCKVHINKSKIKTAFFLVSVVIIMAIFITIFIIFTR